MTTIAIINQKGGTGKTTTSVNLGAALASLGKEVLLVDMDSQGNLSYSLGLNDFKKSIADVLLGDADLNDVIHSCEGMKVVPSDMSLVDAEISLTDSESRESTLSNILTEVEGIDYVLIDCPPSLSVLTVNALCASQQVIIPMQMEVLSLRGLDQIVESIRKLNEAFELNIEVAGILPVMVDKRRKLSQEVHAYIDENYDLKVFDSMIRTNVKASEAPSFGQSVVAYDPQSNSAKDYMKFAKEFVNLNTV